MRAAWYEHKGEAADVLRLGDMDDPEPGAGEVRVAVHASGVNPSDTKQRGGRSDPGSDKIDAMPFPRIVPHNDGAGVINQVGAGVSPDRIGERVWIYEAQLGRAFGTAAELVVVPSERAVRLPDDVSFVEGACLGVPALTAHRCVFQDGAVDGQTVLVTGGAGAVGYYAVQFASRGGARVVATVGDDGDVDRLLAAGAALVVNYKSHDWPDQVLALTGSPARSGGVDRVIDVAFGSNIAQTADLLKSNGVIATYASDAEPEPVLPFYPLLINGGATIHINLVYAMSDDAHRAAVEAIGAALADHGLSHAIVGMLPLEQVVEAHRMVEAGAGGKIIVEIS